MTTATLAIAPAANAAAGPRFTAADSLGTAAASRAVAFNVYLPLRNKDALNSLIARQQDKTSADFHKWITPAQFAAQFGPSAATVAAVSKELAAHGFAVTQNVRTLHVVGTAAQVREAFGAELSLVRSQNGSIRPVALAGIKLTPALSAAGARIAAFSPRRAEMQTHSQKIDLEPAVAYVNYQVYWFDGLKEAYAYPANNATATAFDGTVRPLNGSGAAIGALMSSDIIDSDIAAMFDHEQYKKFAGGPLPKISHVYIDGTQPGGLTGAFDEASLDTQQEIGGAPGASVTLYDIPDLSTGSILDGYSTIDDNNVTDVVSSSFGGCELAYTAAYNGGVDYTYYFELTHELFLQGNAQGITFLASSGDSAGRSCPSFSYFEGEKANFVPSVENPADDTAVTAVGGTNLQTAIKPGKLNSVYKSENAYSDPEKPYDIYGLGEGVTGGYWGAGGGASIYFTKPDYQSLVHTTTAARTLPDVGMQVGGCPGGISKLPCDGGDQAINGNGNRLRSAAYTYLDGGIGGFIGTSVASPEFASAVAILVELKGRQGNLNPYLYAAGNAQMAAGASAVPAFHTKIPGYNSVHPNTFPAADYNYTVGLGTPFVASLMGVPAGTPLAGTPQTVSNP